ncbi:hypothetical protein ACJX0J_024634, partial [Zea mays]
IITYVVYVGSVIVSYYLAYFTMIRVDEGDKGGKVSRGHQISIQRMSDRGGGIVNI